MGITKQQLHQMVLDNKAELLDLCSKLIQNKMCCRFFGHMTGDHIIRCLRAKSGCYKSGNSGNKTVNKNRDL